MTTTRFALFKMASSGPAINRSGLKRSVGWVIVNYFDSKEEAEQYAKSYRDPITKREVETKVEKV